MSSPSSRRWRRRGLVAVAGLVLALGIAAAILVLNKPGDVSNPNVQFTAPTTTSAAPHTHHRAAAQNTFVWPFYGYDEARTRDFGGGGHLTPPFHVGWKFNDFALLEFPPVLFENALTFLDFNGRVKSISAVNGHVLWQRKVGTLAAASPAVDVRHKLIYVTLLSATPGAHGPTNGRVVALSAKTGRVVWSQTIPSGTESSPLVHGLSVFVGSQGGTIYSFRTYDGHLNWTYHAAGAVKGGVAFAGGRIFFGDYAGRVYAVNAANGKQIWVVTTYGARFGFGSGTFYAGPAVAYGRVYIGNTDGRVYSFAQSSGALGWATETGGYVYSSPAVTDVPGLGPTVYAGSYSNTFYALNARTGAIRWTHQAGGRISGSATIIGDVVYYSDLGTHVTTGLNLQTGKQVFSFPDGEFGSVIADDQTVYLTGYSTIYQLLAGRTAPRTHRAAPRRPAPHSPKHRRTSGRSRPQSSHPHSSHRAHRHLARRVRVPRRSSRGSSHRR